MEVGAGEVSRSVAGLGEQESDETKLLQMCPAAPEGIGDTSQRDMRVLYSVGMYICMEYVRGRYVCM